jgi:hypothetical protein
VVLNKKGLENLVIDIANIQGLEGTEENAEILMVHFLKREMGEDMVLGIFIHPDGDARMVNVRKILDCWHEIKSRGDGNGGGGLVKGGVEDMGGRVPVVAGQRLNLSDLFGPGV